MSIKLEFKTVAQCKPEDDEEIMFVVDQRFYSQYELRHGVVTYMWEVVDEKGNLEGCSILYDANIKQPENTILVMIVDRVVMDENTLWAPLNPFWDSIEQHNNLKY